MKKVKTDSINQKDAFEIFKPNYDYHVKHKNPNKLIKG